MKSLNLKKVLSIYIKDNLIFIDKNTKIIIHGGGYILEVLVPFIEI